jgi:hypothetical protein
MLLLVRQMQREIKIKGIKHKNRRRSVKVLERLREMQSA